MSFNRKTLLWLSIVAFSDCACVDKTELEAKQKRTTIAVEMQKQPFSQIIDSFASKIPSITTYTTLYNYDDLIILYENSYLFVDSVVNYLASSNSSDKKEIACFILRKLPEKDYIDFVERAAVIYKKGQIDNQLMKHILFPPQSKFQPIEDNYSNPKVKSILQEIKNSPRADEKFRTEIESVIADND